MSPLAKAKLGFAVAGIACFGAGIRLEHDLLRWVGLALVATAWLLRFVKPRATHDD